MTQHCLLTVAALSQTMQPTTPQTLPTYVQLTYHAIGSRNWITSDEWWKELDSELVPKVRNTLARTEASGALPARLKGWPIRPRLATYPIGPPWLFPPPIH
jgi:hypothetical protein